MKYFIVLRLENERLEQTIELNRPLIKNIKTLGDIEKTLSILHKQKVRIINWRTFQ